MKATWRALIGVLIAVGATFSYFTWWVKNPRVGELTWPLWVAIGAGIVFAGSACFRPPAQTKRGDRIGAGVGFALTLVVAGLFGYYASVFSVQLPVPTWSALELGRKLPDVALIGADGKTFDLAAEARDGALKGRKLLLSFFRGHW